MYIQGQFITENYTKLTKFLLTLKQYLCSGAGGIGGIFINERYTKNGGSQTFPMLQGWWGNNIKTKFMMKEGIYDIF